MNKLMIVKMTDGSTLLTEVYYNDDTYIFDFKNPLVIRTQFSPEGEVTTSFPYLIGTDDEIIPIPATFVITMSPANEFFTKFYGSAMLKFFLQNEIRKTAIRGETELSSETKDLLEQKREEILNRYGMIDDEGEKTEPNIDAQEIKKDRILH
jgi:hypothetical protein